MGRKRKAEGKTANVQTFETLELGSFPQQAEVTQMSADVERLTFNHEFLRPLSSNYSRGLAAPITGGLIV